MSKKTKLRDRLIENDSKIKDNSMPSHLYFFFYSDRVHAMRQGESLNLNIILGSTTLEICDQDVITDLYLTLKRLVEADPKLKARRRAGVTKDD